MIAESSGVSGPLFNRELSWLEFERRILDEARRADVPLLERLKFLSIFSTNLDEFFMVRLAGLLRQIEAGLQTTSHDGMTPREIYQQAYQLCKQLTGEQYECFHKDILPELDKHGIRFVPFRELQGEPAERMTNYFRNEIHPLLTPVAVDPSHPFPSVNNKTLNIALLLRETGEPTELEKFAIVQVPTVVSRFVRIEPARQSGKNHEFVLLDDLVREHLKELFPGYSVRETAVFRLTRDNDLSLDEQEEGRDLLETIRKELLRRKRAAAVRLEVQKGISKKLLSLLQGPLDIEEIETAVIDGPVHLGDMMEFVSLIDAPALRYPAFQPVLRKGWDKDDNIFAVIRAGDVLLHHPYDSFQAVVNLVAKAADDPKVQAIKMTLYRAGSDPQLINSLIRASENGKHVTVLVELRARFDEQNNISRAHELERAGVHVVYGIVGLKIHCKALLIIRKEPAGIVRYVHLSSGNYNPVTARIYTDVGYLTCRKDFGEDATTLFNYLTGYAKPSQWHRLTLAPSGLKKNVLRLIRDEIKFHQKTGNGRIVLKMNALVDAESIQALYEASQSGVKIDLIVRGICCLKPGVPGLSDNIRVVAHVDKYLEHSRIFYFRQGGADLVFVSSADWMPRNYYSRVELMFPVLDDKLRDQCVSILETCLCDNASAHLLQPDGSYRRAAPAAGEERFRQQIIFEQLAQKKLNRAHVKTLIRQLKKSDPEPAEPSPLIDAPSIGAVSAAPRSPEKT